MFPGTFPGEGIASPAPENASSQVSCYILLICAARRGHAPLHYLQQVFTTMAGVSAGLEDAHQEGRQANLDRDSAIPGWTNGRRAERWNTATGLARRLQSRGVSAGQLYMLLDALLSRGWDSDAGLERSNQEAERLVPEQSFIGHATCTRLVTGRVAQAEGRLANMRRPAATPTICQHGCGRRVNLPNGSCCQTCPGSHTVQYLESQ